MPHAPSALCATAPVLRCALWSRLSRTRNHTSGSYAAEALASIGPQAAPATKDLARALGDPVPGVRWAAGEALSSIGPAAHAAVPQLIKALEDEFLYVRICAAVTGSIGPKAQTAREALRAAASDPVLRYEVEWALNRIAGVKSGSLSHSTRHLLPFSYNLRQLQVKRVTHPSIGIPPRAETSSGASRWKPKFMVAQSLTVMWSTWVATTRGE